MHYCIQRRLCHIRKLQKHKNIAGDTLKCTSIFMIFSNSDIQHIDGRLYFFENFNATCVCWGHRPTLVYVRGLFSATIVLHTSGRCRHIWFVKCLYCQHLASMWKYPWHPLCPSMTRQQIIDRCPMLSRCWKTFWINLLELQIVLTPLSFMLEAS